MTTNEDIPFKEATNKQKIRLIFPFEKNGDIKKLGARWENEDKYWYYPSLDGELPEDLKEYKSYKVNIKYEEKDFFKTKFPSMRFDKTAKSWYLNQEDYDNFSKM
jgi:5-formyltetrahydrofolate cyclo-ligase